MSNYNASVTVVPQNAWNDKLVDVTEVVDTQKSQYHPTAMLASQYYNNVTKKRSGYHFPIMTFVLAFGGGDGKSTVAQSAADEANAVRILGLDNRLRGAAQYACLGFLPARLQTITDKPKVFDLMREPPPGS